MCFEKVFIFFNLLLLFHQFEAQDSPESCPAGEHRVSGKCELCPPGTYRKHFPFPWYENEDECQLCPKGTFQAHFGAVGKDLCQECPLATFAAKEGSVACEKCPEGELAPTGSSRCLACPAGSMAYIARRDELRCRKCFSGYFRSLEMLSCEHCPSFTISEGGAESCVRCEKGNQCFRCSQNYYRPSWNSSCERCPRGTYTKGRSASSISECLPCPEGTHRGRSDFSCERCDRGSVTGPGGILCRREGTSCPSNFFENSVGDCHTCEHGYRLNRALLQCEKCPNGSVSRGGIAEHCDICPRNMVVSYTGKVCECSRGRYLRRGKCVRCPIGTTNSSPNRYKSCRPCYYGRAPRRGMTECIPCADGSALDEGRNMCVRCDGKNQLIRGEGIRKICLEGRTGCREDEFRSYYGFEFEFHYCQQRACTDDTPVEDIGSKCVLCEKGFILSDHVVWRIIPEKTCEECDNDETSDGGTTTTCVKCPRFQERDRIAGGCKCRRGLIKVDDSCTFCPPGSSSEDGVTCTSCEPGHYSNQFEIFCRRCGLNTYSPGGVALCLTCPSGTRPNRRERATECVPRTDA